LFVSAITQTCFFWHVGRILARKENPPQEDEGCFGLLLPLGSSSRDSHATIRIGSCHGQILCRVVQQWHRRDVRVRPETLLHQPRGVYRLESLHRPQLPAVEVPVLLCGDSREAGQDVHDGDDNHFHGHADQHKHFNYSWTLSHGLGSAWLLRPRQYNLHLGEAHDG
jgi:hypothetical protein